MTFRENVERLLEAEFRKQIRQRGGKIAPGSAEAVVVKDRQAAAKKNLTTVLTAAEKAKRAIPFARGARRAALQGQVAALSRKAEALASIAKNPGLPEDELVAMYRGKIQDTAKGIEAGVEQASLAAKMTGPVETDVPEAAEGFPAGQDWITGTGLSLNQARSVPNILGSLPGQSQGIPSGRPMRRKRRPVVQEVVPGVARPAMMQRTVREVHRRRVPAPALGQDVARGATGFGQDVRRGATGFGFPPGYHLTAPQAPMPLSLEEGLRAANGLEVERRAVDVNRGGNFGFAPPGALARTSSPSGRYTEQDPTEGLDLEVGLDEGIDIDEASQVFGDVGSGAELEPMSWEAD